MGVGKQEKQKNWRKKASEARQIKSHSNHGTNHVDFYFFIFSLGAGFSQGNISLGY